jgi:hypothetical protein
MWIIGELADILGSETSSKASSLLLKYLGISLGPSLSIWAESKANHLTFFPSNIHQLTIQRDLVQPTLELRQHNLLGEIYLFQLANRSPIYLIYMYIFL